MNYSVAEMTFIFVHLQRVAVLICAVKQMISATLMDSLQVNASKKKAGIVKT